MGIVTVSHYQIKFSKLLSLTRETVASLHSESVVLLTYDFTQCVTGSSRLGAGVRGRNQYLRGSDCSLCMARSWALQYCSVLPDCLRLTDRW